MKSLLLDYGFNIMEYSVLEDYESYFVVLSHITGKTYRVEKGARYDVITT